MAQQMEMASSGLVLQIPNADNEELMRHMGAAKLLGLGSMDGLSDFTGCAINTNRNSTMLTLSTVVENIGIIPAQFQTAEYMLALFKGLGYRPDDPLVKWGLEARLARTELMLRAAGTIINLFSTQALQTSEAIGREVLAGQLENILDITAKHSQITARLVHSRTLNPPSLGFRSMALIYPAGEPVSSEDNRPVVGFKDTIRQSASDIPKMRQTWDGIVSRSSPPQGTLQQIKLVLKSCSS